MHAEQELTSKYQGRYIRVGRSSRLGPIYIIRRYDRNRQVWTVENIRAGETSTLSHKELLLGLSENIVHIIGKVGRD